MLDSDKLQDLHCVFGIAFYLPEKDLDKLVGHSSLLVRSMTGTQLQSSQCSLLHSAHSRSGLLESSRPSLLRQYRRRHLHHPPHHRRRCPASAASLSSPRNRLMSNRTAVITTHQSRKASTNDEGETIKSGRWRCEIGSARTAGNRSMIMIVVRESIALGTMRQHLARITARAEPVAEPSILQTHHAHHHHHP